MLILLPPSEGKTDPSGGATLSLAALAFPELTQPRTRVLDTVVRLAGGPRQRARTVLGLSQRQDAEVERDAAVRDAATAAAGLVYTGVLYDALGYRRLSAGATARANRWVVVCSGMFGAVRLGDPIPAYRLSADVVLPRLGRVSAFWRRFLDVPLTTRADDGVVLDLRSAAYAAMWAPPPRVAERVVVGRVLQRRPDGSTAVVSHHNKATKGRLVRDLVEQRTDPAAPADVAHVVAALGYDVDLVPTRAGQPARLDVIVDEP